MAGRLNVCIVGNNSITDASTNNIERISVGYGTRVLEIAAKYAHFYKNPILIARVNNELFELRRKVISDCEIQFLDMTHHHGFRVYQRTASFIMVCAMMDILGENIKIVIEHSINKNYYCELYGELLTDDLLEKIEKRMYEIVRQDIPIEKITLSLEEGIKLCEEIGAYDKVGMLKYRRTSNVSFYKLGRYYDYFYGLMANSTGCIKLFSLSREMDGFLLQFPSPSNPHKIAEKKVLSKISNIFNESNHWAKILKVDSVGALNSVICNAQIGSFILTNEALHEKRIAGIADMIHTLKRRIVMIAGPSSSGKTTFAKRLAIQLRVNGLKPHIISLDNYFVEKERIPLDEFGQPNFEDLHAIDVKQINKDLENLLRGSSVEIPVFSFLTGQRERKGIELKLDSDDILIIEGIHGLNEQLTENISKDDKFKIFISALTQINIDDHNRIATTDTRLIRRIVRDKLFRNSGAVDTLEMWPSVGRGERKYIFPYQEDADIMFNSALVYEMCVLKQFAEPLLFGIDKSIPIYAEARRLIKFLDSFLGIPCDDVPQNSILREFIGGSCFKV